MNERNSLMLLSKEVGQRFDMVQAGGGNVSVKGDDGTMYIKASGIGLSEVECDKGISIVVDGVSINDVQPSMEKGMHALLDRWVVHTHPLVVCMVACCLDWRDLLSNLFPGALLVEYCSPGLELALVLQRERDRLGRLPQVIFLQNHGLIVHGNDPDIILHLTETVIVKLEEFLHVNFNRYKQTTRVSHLIRKQMVSFNGIAYLSEDGILSKILQSSISEEMRPCTPDVFVYCGYDVVKVSSLDDIDAIAKYVGAYKTYPRVLVYQDDIFFLAQSVRKAQEIEAVFKAQAMMTFYGEKKQQPLALGDLQFLAAMDSEKYRQNC